MPRTVLVTGATSGIGLETVLHLARQGFRTVGTARSPEKAEALRRRIEDAGADIEVLAMDLSDPDLDLRPLDDLAIWGLVNNVGYINAGTVEDVPAEAARAQLEAMVIAPTRLAQRVLPAMRAAGEGRIVNISSVLAHSTGPMVGWYQAAKHALSALNDALRVEVAGFGVDVVAIEPGGHRSRIWARAEADLLARRDGSVYASSYDRAIQLLRSFEPHMPSAGNVAEVVVDVLNAEHPRDRYLVGTDAYPLEVLHSLAPTAVEDRITRAALDL